ncbi:hypothetical protein PUNSTDRAFT_56127 [Punctularia strigosozonata HHB-11173 SS5]|uniref:Uncharacterized protein n=1 Tax=Punctularia strigosozonata (strain HHB-11173) TaxID=741275 RepID=R7S353_PUNST|nr:uncharacterized protein PUNSTDRAFT_56127 [Punctularia strigosozonata HHB-11173 SS5]EIN03681.1 hypothetical protein PUNSTDRAFT_56127 [Punctularia strigosozonata HHB-11173 SS5]
MYAGHRPDVRHVGREPPASKHFDEGLTLVIELGSPCEMLRKSAPVVMSGRSPVDDPRAETSRVPVTTCGDFLRSQVNIWCDQGAPCA